jgi:hypothetical protein
VPSRKPSNAPTKKPASVSSSTETTYKLSSQSFCLTLRLLLLIVGAQSQNKEAYIGVYFVFFMFSSLGTKSAFLINATIGMVPPNTASNQTTDSLTNKVTYQKANHC